MSLKNYSTTAASNTSAPPDGCPEGWSLSSINDWGRQVMADVRTLAASDTIASATTCDLGSLDATFLTVSGTTTITGLGTVSAGIYKFVTFSGALVLTHNATSLILPGAANITTVAGDTALFLSLGSGNWKCMGYTSSGIAPLKSGVYQPLDALLTALAGQTTAANNVQAYSGADTPTLLTTGTASGNIPLVGTSSATDVLPGLVELATSAEVAAGTDTARAITPAGLAASKIVAGTAIATTSGTAHDFTGIPAWAKRVTMTFAGVSTNGTSSFLVQIGSASGIEVTGYASAASGITTVVGSANYTTGFGLSNGVSAAAIHSGVIEVVLLNASTNTWSMRSTIQDGTPKVHVGSGSKSLAATLDRIRVTTANGTDTFDAGSVNILYE